MRCLYETWQLILTSELYLEAKKPGRLSTSDYSKTVPFAMSRDNAVDSNWATGWTTKESWFDSWQR
jgi:hypothetical protein